MNKMVEKELTIEELKKISLDILDEVHFFCEQNHLRYILFSGSLLGCIRHKGFIPWDDDIDIAMPREDYEIFAKKFSSNKYTFIDYENESWYYLPWGKVADLATIKYEPVHVKKNRFGVDIDIYPCDYIETIEQGIFLKDKINKIDKKRGHSIRLFNKNLIKNFFTLFYRGKHTKYCRQETSLSAMFNKGPRNFIFRNCNFSKAQDIYPIDMFDNRILADFEDRKYYIPVKYDEILKLRYGDYMKLPKKEDQIPHHINKTYYLNK